MIQIIRTEIARQTIRSSDHNNNPVLGLRKPNGSTNRRAEGGFRTISAGALEENPADRSRPRRASPS
jgi:hypothetical protein